MAAKKKSPAKKTTAKKKSTAKKSTAKKSTSKKKVESKQSPATVEPKEEAKEGEFISAEEAEAQDKAKEEKKQEEKKPDPEAPEEEAEPDPDEWLNAVPGIKKARADLETRFQKGNEFWRKRSKHGRNRIIESPEVLEECLFEFLEEISNSPFIEEKSHHFKGDSVRDAIAKPRAPTIEAFRAFMRIGRSTWYDLANKEKNPDFSDITEFVEDLFRGENIAGAAAGVYNSNIIARYCKLVDGIDHTSQGAKIPTLADFYAGKLPTSNTEEETTPEQDVAWDFTGMEQYFS